MFYIFYKYNKIKKKLSSFRRNDNVHKDRISKSKMNIRGAIKTNTDANTNTNKMLNLNLG